MIELLALEAYCNDLLCVSDFDDYCPNGLQVEAGDQVRRVMLGVTASQALIEAAAEWQADLLLVHHGYFWKGEGPSLRGMKGQRVRRLFESGISLMAYHLPLDAHPEYGNNAELGRLLGFQNAAAAESGNGLIWHAELGSPMSGESVQAHLKQVLSREPLHIPGRQEALARIGWCTGAAQGYLEKAAAMGLDAFISGEISEATVHTARELGIDYFAAGHHATERYGVQALGRHLAERFDLTCEFVDIDNPV